MTARTREEVSAIVIDTVAAIAPEIDFSTLNRDRPLREQIDIDSFDFLNVIIRLHERLGVDIPEVDYGEFATLDSAVDYLTKKCSGGA